MGDGGFRKRRLAAALAIGPGILVAEAIFAIFCLPQQWAEVAGEWPLQPASYFVTYLAKAKPLGFDGQVAYFFLVVILQWLLYSDFVYLLLAIFRKKRKVL